MLARITFALALVGAIIHPACGFAADTSLTPEEKQDGWILLFNGEDFTGWQAGTNSYGPYRKWIIEEEAIRTSLFGGKAKFVPPGHLMTEEEYGDYILELEFQSAPGTHSGVLLRQADPKRQEATGLEVQIYSGGSKAPHYSTGSFRHFLQGPAKQAALPDGEWNRLRITMQHPQVTVELNGETVNELDLSQWTEPGKRPDGGEHRMANIALSDMPRSGRIGFRDDHGSPIAYRNIKLKRLNDVK
ncbi:MAG: DUF1080 domain-containing protein [Planctomycetaceae bacterium]